jgi:capsular polysaccharide biosynthesis protein
MSVSREPDTFVSGDYLGVLRRGWWLVLVVTVVGLLGAVGYLAVTPKAYTATAKVNVTSTGSTGAVTGGRTTGVVNLDTEAQIVKSGVVAGIAGHTLHSSLSSTKLLNQVTVTVPANSSVLEISCQEGSANGAAACANAFAAAYLQNRDATAAAAAKAQLAGVQHQLTALQNAVAKLTVQIPGLAPKSSRRATAAAELEADKSQLGSLASQFAALTTQGASPSGGSIISSATPPGRASSPKKLLVLPSGLLVGLILGLAAAFARDRLNTRVKDPKDAEQRFGVPVLLSLSSKEMGRPQLAPASSAAGRAFAELARNAAAALGDGDRLLIAGTAAGRGSAVVAANVAVALARRHGDVVLVCPSQQGAPELFGLADSQALGAHGAVQLASGAVSLDQAAQQPQGFPGLHVLVLGAGLADLADEQARQLAAHLRSSADFVLVEAPWSAPGEDGLAFAEFCDGALLAVEIPGSRYPEVEDCLTRLSRLGVTVIGAATVPELRGTPRPPRAQQQPAELPYRGRRAVTASPGPQADERDALPGWPEPEAAGGGTGRPSMSAPGHAEAAERFSGN